MTLAQLRTALQTRGYGTDTATQQTEFLNSAYRRLAGLARWSWLEATTTATLVVGSATVTPVATDVRDYDSIRLDISSTYIDLEYLAPQEFLSRSHLDRDNGIPEYWTQTGGTVQVFPRPDQAYTARIQYIKDPADLSADGDIPVVPVTSHDILVWGAIADIAFRERDTYMIGYAKQEYASCLADLTRQDGVRQRQNATTVRRSSFWGTVGT